MLELELEPKPVCPQRCSFWCPSTSRLRSSASLARDSDPQLPWCHCEGGLIHSSEFLPMWAWPRTEPLGISSMNKRETCFLSCWVWGAVLLQCNLASPHRYKYASTFTRSLCLSACFECLLECLTQMEAFFWCEIFSRPQRGESRRGRQGDVLLSRYS